ncbi:MAG TPA: nitroreductase family deazaflavin-dependent oxidoreductase [Thermomicrobiales bacterium]|jgi:deazaflavin-dependent oxidoreductase (nitroreductase family)|nr:nitroreductase family deazaflavin-dependent oxidoreductase [Thermomicrobiales bacterium]
MAIYQRPGWLTQRIANPLVAFVTGRLGRSLRGSRVLAVRGRRSGEWRTTPVNPLDLDERRYLVAPRGETEWVRNLRAAGSGELRLGGAVERFQASEVADADKPPILRAYLDRWRSETGTFFGVSADPSEADLVRIAPNHPVFLIHPE